MASWESRFWPARRWLADRLVGQRGYSKNVVTPATTRFVDSYGQEWIVPRPPPDMQQGERAGRWFETLDSSQRRPVNGSQFRPIFDQDANQRSPQETA